MNHVALSAIELCAGVGMLGEGVRAAFEHLGCGYRTVAYVEREAPAAAQLVTLMEAGCLDEAPVWSDVLTFDGAAWRGKVDCIAAGFPCQDISIAGRRDGLDGKRSGLFFDILDIADDCGAWFLALENVAGIATATATVVDAEEGELEERAAARVVGELADRGWNAEWLTLSASDVGASHGRARWFCLAWRLADTGRWDAQRVEQERLGERGGAPEHHARSEAVDDAARHGNDGPHGEAGLGWGVCEAGDSMAHPERPERRQECSCGTGCVQGNDRGRRETDCGAGVADTALANAPDDQRRRGDCGTQAGTRPDDQRRRGLAGGCRALAEPARDGRHEGRPEPIGEQGRPDATERSGAVADTSSTRLQGREQRGTRIGNRGGAGSTWTS